MGECGRITLEAFSMQSGYNNTPEQSGAYRPELILDKIPVR